MESRSDDRGRFVRQVRRRHAGSARGHTYGPIWRGSNGPCRLSDRRRRTDLVFADHGSGNVLSGVFASVDRFQHWRVYSVDVGGKRVDADSPGHSRRDRGWGQQRGRIRGAPPGVGNLLVWMAAFDVFRWRCRHIYGANLVPGRLQAATASRPASHGFQ